MDLDALASQRREGSWPRVETARAVVDSLRRLGEVERAILLLNHARVCGALLGLRHGAQLAAHEARQRLADQLTGQCGQPLEQLAAGLVLADRQDAPVEHGAGVHADVHLHEADARLAVAADDGPLDGRRAAKAR